ncbi:Rieske 2Fe-2S domain-containing protein [Ammoniphilus resinae]|uniref:Phenylpropionate dioxygenase-like ring-hydroxylating dioxygenase large terminal subunit n=1 Tax=Ammoniphilus resinae TaxID=861532 RepID=A0ABS4GLZ6_9BACL|nr:Rieske 2Fe-2S domain-containing protein [Ammoniphilus resinae]MBP1931293.1 phenylpropionate dioxygenase-like ring-hydroxylating dioxygenase large terminal subunit [Ammoniphilus resinae]
MLSREQNVMLTKSGPGTPMGELLRLYWFPALLSSELPEPGGPPVRVKLLNEDLVAFRDEKGVVGIIDERCPHRGVSLYFGVNQGCGLQCAYHGWTFDTQGNCTDMPSEPPESNFKSKVKIKSYSTIERGGVIWTYMGPEDQEPPFPNLIWNTVDESQVFVTKRIQQSNFFQALEGGLDSSHISILHKGAFDYNVSGASDIKKFITNSAAPKYVVLETDFGALMGAGRDAGEYGTYWRTTAFLMPFFQMVCPYSDEPRNGHVWVPIDDETCMNWCLNWHPTRALTEQEIENFKKGLGIHTDLIPGTFYPVQNKENDYLIDRGLQTSGKLFSGIKGVGTQDAAMQESQGAIFDRTNERLGLSDAAIIALRRMLLRAMADLEKGTYPASLQSNYHIVDAPAMVLPKNETFRTKIFEELKYGVPVKNQ